MASIGNVSYNPHKQVLSAPVPGQRLRSSIDNKTGSNSSSGHNINFVTYVLEQPLITRVIPPPRKKKLKRRGGIKKPSIIEASNSKGKRCHIKYSNIIPQSNPFEFTYKSSEPYFMHPYIYFNQIPFCNSKRRKKSSLKYTQSTASSFTFLPTKHYHPIKPNSSTVNHGDNYILYATPQTKFPKQNATPFICSNNQNCTKSIKHKSTKNHQPSRQTFGICTCS